MSKYELDELDIKNLIAIIDSADIKGSSSETVALLKQKLRNPVKEKDGTSKKTS